MIEQSHLTIVSPDSAPSNLGRFMQRRETWHEGQYMNIAADMTGGRSAVEVARQHDQMHDRYLAEALRLVRRALHPDVTNDGRQVLLRRIGRMVMLAQSADAAEDLQIEGADGRMASAQDVARAGAGAVELLLVRRTRP